MSDLDACPHCGQAGFARVKRWPWEKDGKPGLVWGFHVICDASGIDTHPRGCGASSGWGETPEEAIAAWNRRAYLAASGEVAHQPAHVAVKPLVWGPRRAIEGVNWAWDAKTSIGWYVAATASGEGCEGSHFWFIVGETISAWADSEAEAKAAAQADYETRIRSALAQPSAPEGWVMVPEEPDRATLERLASMWGYTLEETADSYGAFLEATAARPAEPPPAGFDAVDLDMIKSGDRLGPALGQRVFDALSRATRAEERIAEMEAALAEAEDVFALVEHPAFPDPVHHDRVKALGREIGFGALMATASAGWREVMAEKGYPLGSEFVAGPCHGTVVSVLEIIRRARAIRAGGE